jgi:formate/nitrite transporter FocA (FNT family)
MSPDATNKMFLSAAICNWIVALGLFFIPELFLSAFFVTPTPGHSKAGRVG